MQVSMQIALLERRSISELQEIWKKYFDAPPTTYNKEFYISRIAHRIQELAYGGLSANQQKLIANMYVPPEDRNNVVTVMKDGFEYNGMKYSSLSAVAKKITGRKISGRYFFGLDK